MDYSDDWSLPPQTIHLPGDEVHVWRVALDLKEAARERLLGTLSPDERSRAGRFRFQKDRDHFIAGRGTLRSILSLYLRAEPSRLSFRSTYYGKLYLDGELARSGIRFNLSHSHGLALYAVTSDREIGIDLEYIRSEVAAEQIAERFFSAREVKKLRSLPEASQAEAFFNCWTRKEAFIKARGEGLSLPLEKFDVSLAPGEPAALLETRIDDETASRWEIRDLPAGPAYKAALAVEGRGWRLKCWQWLVDPG
ncbi:MAG TPA: 4'-phosphopantetheinyl transferase superfamily protein [Blastocatellia bacterium]|nr:4'-phosphopantetheinyl transferase superfamily protein [Blastocatellia bacterium]